MIQIDGSISNGSQAQSWSWYVGLAQLTGFPSGLRKPVFDYLAAELGRIIVSSRRNEWRWAPEEPEAEEEVGKGEGLAAAEGS